MILKQTNDVKVEGSLPGKTVEMTLAAEASEHFISMFIDQYKNRLLAVLREYSTNALDAQIEVGVHRPIEVTLPNRLAPYLSIQDFGVGLTEQDIEEVYSQFGASTKRHSNDFNGALGIGCKAGMTYTNGFTVVSVKDGRRIQAVINRHPKGATVQVVDNSPTSDPTGTTVAVEIKREDFDRIAEMAADFYRFWKPGTVLVNGKRPARIEGLRLSETMFVTESDLESYVVMGNVGYPVTTHKIAPGLSHGYGLVAFVPNGSCSFTPDREGLTDDAGTKATLAKVAADFKRCASEAVQKAVTAAKTPTEAIDMFNRYEGMYPAVARASYRGKVIPLSYKPPHVNYRTVPETRMLRLNHYYKGKAEDVFDLQSRVWTTALFITDWDHAKWSGPMRDKLNLWGAQNNVTINPSREAILIMPTLPDEIKPWLRSEQIVSWEKDIKPIKLPSAAKRPSPSGRLPGSYDFYADYRYNRGVAGEEIEKLLKASYPVFYIHGNRYEASALMPAVRAVAGHDKFVLVSLSGNRIDKFKRNIPEAKEASQFVRDGFDKWVKGLSDDVKASLAMKDAGWRHVAEKIDPAKVTDPLVKEAARVARVDTQVASDARDVFARIFGFRASRAPFVASKNPTDRYPLFSHTVLDRKPEHVYNYMNNAYANGL